MIMATVPTVTILLFFVGALDRVREGVLRVVAWVKKRREVLGGGDETDVLFALGLLAAVAPWLLLPKTPIFGGTKHWMPAYPFLALFAGRGFDLLANAIARALSRFATPVRIGAEVATVACVLAAPLAITIHSHPFGLSSYVPLVGGTAGGADFGLNRQFWGYTSQDAAPWLATNAQRGATVFIHDTAWDAWNEMIVEGRMRSDLRGVGAPGEAQIALIQHELHMSEVDYQVWVAFGTDAPAYVVTHDGVPIESVYAR
jgi:hypothetical protein